MQSPSGEEILIAAIHEHVTAPDGTANAIAKVVARIRPVGLDALSAQQGQCDLAVRCPGQRAVKRLEDKAQTAGARFGRKQPVGKLPGRVKSIEAFERIQVMSHPIGGPDRVDGKANGAQNVRALHSQL